MSRKKSSPINPVDLTPGEVYVISDTPAQNVDPWVHAFQGQPLPSGTTLAVYLGTLEGFQGSTAGHAMRLRWKPGKEQPKDTAEVLVPRWGRIVFTAWQNGADVIGRPGNPRALFARLRRGDDRFQTARVQYFNSAGWDDSLGGPEPDWFHGLVVVPLNTGRIGASERVYTALYEKAAEEHEQRRKAEHERAERDSQRRREQDRHAAELAFVRAKLITKELHRAGVTWSVFGKDFELLDTITPDEIVEERGVAYWLRFEREPVINGVEKMLDALTG